MTASPQTFDGFYVAYLAQHRHPANRALHLFAKVAMAALLVLAIFDRSWLALLAAPFAGVLPCWLGHRLVEHNRPTSWTQPTASLLGTLLVFHRDTGAGRPYWSLLADLRMCASMLGLASDETVPDSARPDSTADSTAADSTAADAANDRT